MKSERVRILAISAALGLALLGGATPPKSAAKSFRLSGMYVEGCSCASPCPCELVGVEMGCQGVGAFQLSGGSYGGVDLSGVRIAYATEPGKWVRLFVQAKSGKQRQAAEALARGAFTPFGTIESISDAKIAISGKGGKYVATVNGGSVMKLVTEPIMGSGKSPIEIRGIHDALHPNVMMGKTKSCSYNDGTHSFTLSDRNAYFADRLNSSGKI